MAAIFVENPVIFTQNYPLLSLKLLWKLVIANGLQYQNARWCRLWADYCTDNCINVVPYLRYGGTSQTF
jgi:hypothetical protein